MGKKSGATWGEDFSTCQESTGSFGADFGEHVGNFVSKLVTFFFRKLRSAEGRY